MAAIATLWQLGPVRKAVAEHVPLVAQIITLPAIVTPAPPMPAVPKPAARAARKSAEAQLAERSATPAIAALPSPAAVEAPAMEFPAAPGPVIIAAPGTARPPPAPPSALPTAPPRFDADYLRNPPPEYPALSRRRGEEGRVLLRVHVASDGTPREVELDDSSGSERLDRVALETVKRWKFVAARLGDTAIDAWVLVPIAFSLAH